jgi:hypothetical protein
MLRGMKRIRVFGFVVERLFVALGYWVEGIFAMKRILMMKRIHVTLFTVEWIFVVKGVKAAERFPAVEGVFTAGRFLPMERIFTAGAGNSEVTRALFFPGSLHGSGSEKSPGPLPPCVEVFSDPPSAGTVRI